MSHAPSLLLRGLLVAVLALAAVLVLPAQSPGAVAEAPPEAIEEPSEEELQWWLEEDPEVPAPLPGLPAAPTTPTTGRAPKVPYAALIASTARKHRVPVALLTALVWQESGFKARARSHAGARGLTQLMPATARMLGVRKIYDPAQNLDGGARYLRSLLTSFRGNKRLALAGYNAGPGAVRRFKGVPPYAETQSYVRRVLGREQELRKAGVP